MTARHDTPSTEARRRRVSTSNETPTSRLQWVFIVLITLSVTSVFAVSSRLRSSPRFQLVQTPQNPLPTAAVEESHSKMRTMEADSLFSSKGLGGTQDSGTTELSAADHDTMIPRIIHQSWKQIDRIPTRFHPWMKSWVNFHPNWTYVFWTDEDNLKLFELLYPQYLHVAKAVKKVSLADMARYALLHRIGGLYVDADFECLQPFDGLHRDHKLFLSSEPLAHTVLLEKTTSAMLCNALMASAPGHPFWLHVLDNIKEKFARERLRSDAVGLTGPRMVNHTYMAQKSMFDSEESAMTALPSEYFYPEVAYWNIEPMEEACQRRKDDAAKEACEWLHHFPNGEFTSNTYATHHWQCTWCRDAKLDEFAPLSAIFESPPLRPNITAAGIELHYA